MSKSQSLVFKLKLIIDSQSNRLLYAEFEQDCWDFLFSILYLPVDKILKVVSSNGTMNIMRNLHNSLQHLDPSYMTPNFENKHHVTPYPSYMAPNFENKHHVPPYLGPSIPLLQINRDNYIISKCLSCPTTFCSNSTSFQSSSAKEYCNSCKKNVLCELYSPPTIGDSCGVVKRGIKYMLMDDLVVMPLTSQSLLNVFNDVELKTVKEKEVSMGRDEAVKIVTAMIKSTSNTILTDVFLVKEEKRP